MRGKREKLANMLAVEFSFHNILPALYYYLLYFGAFPCSSQKSNRTKEKREREEKKKVEVKKRRIRK